MKPLTKDEIIHILKRTPSPDILGFVVPNEQGYLVKRNVFDKCYKRKQDIVEFLSSTSLTKTIVDIRHRFIDYRCEIEVWLSNSVLETNIDWDIIVVFLKNIGHRGINEL